MLFYLFITQGSVEVKNSISYFIQPKGVHSICQYWKRILFYFPSLLLWTRAVLFIVQTWKISQEVLELAGRKKKKLTQWSIYCEK